MKITVIGKAHLEGISKKTNKEYNFNQVHFIGTDRYVEGQAAKTLAIHPNEINYKDIQLNAVYDVEFDSRGNVIGFELIRPFDEKKQG